MSRAGEVYENPITGERVVIRLGTEETHGELLVADLYITPGGRVAAEHVHPNIDERFTVFSGRVGFRLNGQESIAVPGDMLEAPRGTPHDWWNAGHVVAHVRVAVRPAARFEAMIMNMFNLARDGRTNSHGMPSLLQLALLAREFDDVIRFTHPPRIVQRVLFAALAPIARLRGLRGGYDEYLSRGPVAVVPVDPIERTADPQSRHLHLV
jgi:quercetin dioxygenase-like cupin family protein